MKYEKGKMSLSSELSPIVNLDIPRRFDNPVPNLDTIKHIEIQEIPDKIDDYDSILKTITKSKILKNNRII